jgi:hypothetical protein
MPILIICIVLLTLNQYFLAKKLKRVTRRVNRLTDEATQKEFDKFIEIFKDLTGHDGSPECKQCKTDKTSKKTTK